jgi:hypothetical protein
MGITISKSVNTLYVEVISYMDKFVFVLVQIRPY